VYPLLWPQSERSGAATEFGEKKTSNHEKFDSNLTLTVSYSVYGYPCKLTVKFKILIQI